MLGAWLMWGLYGCVCGGGAGLGWDGMEVRPPPAPTPPQVRRTTSLHNQHNTQTHKNRAPGRGEVEGLRRAVRYPARAAPAALRAGLPLGGSCTYVCLVGGWWMGGGSWVCLGVCGDLGDQRPTTDNPHTYTQTQTQTFTEVLLRPRGGRGRRDGDLPDGRRGGQGEKMADVVFCWVGLGWIVWVENRQIVAFNAIDIPNLSTTNPNTPAIQPTNRCRRSGRAGWGRLPR